MGLWFKRASPGWFLLLAAVASLAACQRGAVPTASTSLPPTAGASPSQLTPAPLVAGTAGPLTITITSPADETVVNVPQVDVLGQAPPETVITINDNLVVVDATGQFSTTVPLQEGPNELDVVASDLDGNQATTRLIVTFDPTG